MYPENHRSKALQSWKEIAGFFDVTVRSVQNWEEERGLPVHRMPGAKGRVYAYVEELETWRQQGFPPGGKTAHANEHAAVHTPSRRLLLVSLAALLPIVFGLAWVVRPRVNPNLYRLEGRTAVVYDEQGRVAWRYSFPSVPVPVDEGNPGGADASRLVDVDGDGRRELLFPLARELNSPEDDELYLFSADGRLQWKRRFGQVVKTCQETQYGPFMLRRIALVPVPGRKESRILVVSNQRIHSATLVSLLDGKGNVLREYWHAGHVITVLVADHDQDGKPEIYLGGIANGYECADLTVLDPETFSGASVETDPEEQILNAGAPVEKARLLMPRSSINRILSPYNRVDSLMSVGTSLRVGTSEILAGPDQAGITLYFGPKLVLQNVHVADGNQALYRKLHAQKLIPTELTQAEIDSYRNIRVLTPWRD